MADTDPESAAIDPELAARLYDLADDAMVDNDAVDWFGLFERNKPQIPDENARQRYCRTFMFVQVCGATCSSSLTHLIPLVLPRLPCSRALIFIVSHYKVLFRRFPGTLEFDEVRAMAADLNANPIAGGANASAAEMDAFLAPNGAPDREPRDQRQVQPPPQGQLAIHPQPVGLVGGGLLEWHCRWVLRGQFNWATGASDPFRTWLNDNAAAAVATMTTLSASSTIWYVKTAHLHR